LKRLGVAQLLDALVALPLDARNREQLEWIADEVVDAGGEATIWIGRLASAAQEQQLQDRMRDAVANEYRELVAEAASLRSQPAGQRQRGLARLRRKLHRIRARDYFPPPERELAQAAVDELGAVGEEVAS
jgi:hypothetical protein